MENTQKDRSTQNKNSNLARQTIFFNYAYSCFPPINYWEEKIFVHTYFYVCNGLGNPTFTVSSPLLSIHCPVVKSPKLIINN